MEKLTRREFMRLSGTLAVGALAAACAPAAPAAPAAEKPAEEKPAEAPKPAAEAPQKMVFWPEWGGKDADALKVQVDKFAKETGIEVEYLPIRDHTRMIASMGAGEPPDLLMTWDAAAVGSWAFEGALLDLKPYIEASKFDLNALHPLGVASGDLMGIKQIGLPLSNYLTSILYWNKDAFQKAGLDPEKAPETWEELRAAHDKITVVEGGEIKKWGYLIMQGQDGHPLVMAYAFGGKMYSDDLRQVTPDNEGKIESLKWMRGFYETYGVEQIRRWQGSVSLDITSPTNPLYTGDAGMQLTGEWQPSFIDRLEGITVNYGAAYMPYPEAKPDVKGTVTANSNPMVIPSQAKNPDAGWKFIEFISRPENSAEMCDIVGNASPVKEGVELQAAMTKNPVYKWLLEEVWTKANVKPTTINSPVGKLYTDTLVRETALVLEEGKDPLEAMTTVKNEVQPELDAALEELGI